VRPIKVLDLLTNRAGYGFASDFSLPAIQLLSTVQTDGREVQLRPDPDGWLSAIPLLNQPGGGRPNRRGQLGSANVRSAVERRCPKGRGSVCPEPDSGPGRGAPRET
jgi:hypothetical protein